LWNGKYQYENGVLLDTPVVGYRLERVILALQTLDVLIGARADWSQRRFVLANRLKDRRGT
jgi:hypothetical protein